MKQTRPITVLPAHSLQGNTAWTKDEKERSSRSRGKAQQQRRSVTEPDAGLIFLKSNTKHLVVSFFRGTNNLRYCSA